MTVMPNAERANLLHEEIIDGVDDLIKQVKERQARVSHSPGLNLTNEQAAVPDMNGSIGQRFAELEIISRGKSSMDENVDGKVLEVPPLDIFLTTDERETAHLTNIGNLEMLLESSPSLPVVEIDDETFATNEQGGYAKMIRPICEGWVAPVILRETYGGPIDSSENLGQFLPLSLAEPREQGISPYEKLLGTIIDRIVSLEATDKSAIENKEEAVRTITEIETAIMSLKQAYSAEVRLVEEEVAPQEKEVKSEITEKEAQVQKPPETTIQDIFGLKTLPQDARRVIFSATIDLLSPENIHDLLDSEVLPPRLERQLRQALPGKPDILKIVATALPLLRSQYGLFAETDKIISADVSQETNQPNWSRSWLWARAMKKLTDLHRAKLEMEIDEIKTAVKTIKDDGDLEAKEGEIKDYQRQIEQSTAKVTSANNLAKALADFIEISGVCLGDPCFILNRQVLNQEDGGPPVPYQPDPEQPWRIPLRARLALGLFPRALRRNEIHYPTGYHVVSYDAATLLRGLDKGISPSTLRYTSALIMELMAKMERETLAWKLMNGEPVTADQALRLVESMTQKFGLNLAGKKGSPLKQAIEMATAENGVEATAGKLPIKVIFDATHRILDKTGIYEQFKKHGNRSVWVAWQSAFAGQALKALEQSLPEETQNNYFELISNSDEGRVSIADLPAIIKIAERDGHEIGLPTLEEIQEMPIPTVDEIVKELAPLCPGQIVALQPMVSIARNVILNAESITADNRLKPIARLEFAPEHGHGSGASATGKTYLAYLVLRHFKEELNISLPYAKFDLTGAMPIGIEGEHIAQLGFQALVKNTMRLFGCSWNDACAIISTGLAILHIDEVDKRVDTGTGQWTEMDRMNQSLQNELISLMTEPYGYPLYVTVDDKPDRLSPATQRGEIAVNNITFICTGAYVGGKTQTRLQTREALNGVPYVASAKGQDYKFITPENAEDVMRPELAGRFTRYFEIPSPTVDSLKAIAATAMRDRITHAVGNLITKQRLRLNIEDVVIDESALALMAKTAMETGYRIRGLTRRVAPPVVDYLVAQIETGKANISPNGLLIVDLPTVQRALGIRR